MSSKTIETIKDKMKEHLTFLKESMEPDFGLLDTMLANRTINWSDKEAVQNQISSCERNSKLLDYILERDKCDGLMMALTDSDQMHIVNYLTANGEYSNEFGEDWPLTENDISILNTNHRSFVDLLELTDLLGLLYSSKIINKRQMESISSKPTSHEKNNALLGILRRRSLRDYRQVIKCLHESKQSHIATVLECGGVVVRVHASLDGENVTETENEISTAIANMVIYDRSTQEAGRILGLAMAKVIAAKNGQSVVLYVYCKTVDVLQQLHGSLISGRLKDSVELWFNSLLIRSQTTKVVALTTDDEDFPKMINYFKEEEIRRKSLKRKYSDDSEVTENLQKNQQMTVATEEEIRRKSLKRKYPDDSEVTENLQKNQQMTVATGKRLDSTSQQNAAPDALPQPTLGSRGRKGKVVCPISINFTQRINLGQHEYRYVRGIAKLRNEIYIMGSSSKELSVFEDRIPFGLQNKLEMNQFQYPNGMESCEKESCLFVCDWTGQCVWKIAIETEKQHETIKWLTFDYYPKHMSVSSDGELLIINRPSSILMIYGSDAALLRSIQLPTDIRDLRHAVKTSIGNFIIINKEEVEEEEEESDDDFFENVMEAKLRKHWTLREKTHTTEKEEEEMRKRVRVEGKGNASGSKKRTSRKKRNCFIRELTSDGQTVIRRFVPSNETQHLKNDPQYLSIDSDDQVFVADTYNHRVILLDSDLQWKSFLCPINDEEPKIRFPWCLYYDEEKKQLIVGGYGASVVNVYTLSRD